MGQAALRCSWGGWAPRSPPKATLSRVSTITATRVWNPIPPRAFVCSGNAPKTSAQCSTTSSQDSRFGPRVAPTRVGAAGFSLGAYTVIAVAGGRTDLQAFAAFCSGPDRDATCEDQTEFPGLLAEFARLTRVDPRVQESLRRHNASFRDPRIRAVFAIAPVLGGAFTPAGLAEVSIPVALVVGQADTVAPPPTNAQRFARRIPGATLTVLPGQVGHYTFLSQGTAYGKQVSPTFCLDHSSIDREAVHKEVAQMAIELFAQHLATSQASCVPLRRGDSDRGAGGR